MAVCLVVFFKIGGGGGLCTRTGTRKEIGARDLGTVSPWPDLPGLGPPTPRCAHQARWGLGVSLPDCLEERRGGRRT